MLLIEPDCSCFLLGVLSTWLAESMSGPRSRQPQLIMLYIGVLEKRHGHSDRGARQGNVFHQGWSCSGAKAAEAFSIFTCAIAMTEKSANAIGCTAQNLGPSPG